MKKLQIMAAIAGLTLAPLAGCEPEAEERREDLRADMNEAREEAVEHREAADEELAEGAAESASAAAGESGITQEFRGLQAENAVDDTYDDMQDDQSPEVAD
jgi:hypothetical protein